MQSNAISLGRVCARGMFVEAPLLVTMWLVAIPNVAAETPWLAGFSRVDVTPTEPVRMAGYGSRDRPSEGIDTPLFVRAMTLRHRQSEQPPRVMLSVDTIGIPGSLARRLADAIEQRHDVPREHLVVCSTHTHCGPDLDSELSNIFATPLNVAEVSAAKRYQAQLFEGMLRAVDQALAAMSPARLAYDVGEATFAVNRRVLTDGKWSGFGVQEGGVLDHTVPVLRITDGQDMVRGVVFNYACHATTIGGRHYNINADWCGYASVQLESKYPGAIALCTIGCGADANPNPRDSVEAAKIHGLTLASEVGRLVAGEMRSIDQPVTSRFDYAALPFDLPTEEELRQRIADAEDNTARPQARRHAQQLLEVYAREGRLPATYPVPIQAWQFGDQLSMIFLGGEVVVDYALRLKHRLHDPDLWVTAYANDVLGYIASERMRQEGGYEYDRSGVYYGLPGPWAAGTEDLLIHSVEELLKRQQPSRPLPADDARGSLTVPAGLRVELVAAEPLVQDPINLAFGADGKLWVVEMGDYPQGEQGGRIKYLEDRDGDGIFDSATEFLSGLSFPTGVFPWRDGVLVTAAPDILWARDTDGDGRADDVQRLYTGFALANPQHRVNGFTYGLDHSLHLAGGDDLREVTSLVTSQTIRASGHDVQIWPDQGRHAATSGSTQFLRARNDWGQWFGNNNSRPMFHFPIEDAYLQRNPSILFSDNTQQLFDPPTAPRVYPATSANQRFNDLFAANRFTSACSSIVGRTPNFRIDDHDVLFICEPVHNLVHRSLLIPDGASFQARRGDAESQSEFLVSSDPWFRPVQASIGPDGMLWIVDMYRQTIEHPQWIPQAWQQQLDLRAGSDRGRIYRISLDSSPAYRPVNMAGDELSELIEHLRSPIGTIRDLAQQQIIERDEPSAVEGLVRMARRDVEPHARVHALSILEVQSSLPDDLLTEALLDSHPGVLLVALRLVEPRLPNDFERWLPALQNAARHTDMAVVMQAALTLGQTDHREAGKLLGEIASRGNLDHWTARAISSSAKPHAAIVLPEMLDHLRQDRFTRNEITLRLLRDLLRTAQASGVDLENQFAGRIAGAGGDLGQQMELASCFIRTVGKSKDAVDPSGHFDSLYHRALAVIGDPTGDERLRIQAIDMLGIGIDSAASERVVLVDLIHPATPVALQQRAIDCLTELDARETFDAILDRWTSLTKGVREHFISKLLERRESTTWLLDALEHRQIEVNDLTPAIKQQLTRMGSRSMRVRAARLVQSSPSPEKGALLRSYSAAMPPRGDQQRGATIFQQHCAVCHLAGESGQAVGASLNNLTDRSDQALLRAILDPNQAIDPQYQTYLIETEDGRVLAGAIEQEAGASLTIAHADGKRSVVGRDDISAIKHTGLSLMPEGLETVLSHEAMRDLLDYLQQEP